jgi:hypothetical protein
MCSLFSLGILRLAYKKAIFENLNGFFLILPVLRVNEPKMAGARSARARSAAKTV